MIHKYASIIVATVLFTGCATTETKKDTSVTPFSAQGWGGTTCKELIHDITPSNVGFQQAVEHIRLYQSWASGFVSGVNYSDNDVYDVSGATSPEETFAWLKEYCSESPDTAIPVALHELILDWQQQGKVQVKAE